MSIDPDTIAFAHKLAVSRDLFYQSNIAKISSGRCYTPAYPEPRNGILILPPLAGRPLGELMKFKTVCTIACCLLETPGGSGDSHSPRLRGR